MDIKKSLDRYYYTLSMVELRMMNRGNGDEKITYHDALYLDVIASIDRCTVSSLSKMLNVSKPSVTVTINGLEKKGYIDRVKSEEDGRIYYLVLSDMVKKVYAEENVMIDRISKTLITRFSEEEMDGFCRILDVASELLDDDQDVRTDRSVK